MRAPRPSRTEAGTRGGTDSNPDRQRGGVVPVAAAPSAFVCRCGGSGCDREGRFVEQFFREVHTTRERDVERRRAEMLQEETPKMAARDADPIGQPLHPAVIQSTLGDQPERAGYERGGAEPGGRAGRGFRPAAKAWAESRRFGGGGGRKIPDVFVLWRACRTNWTAIDTGAGDGDEEAAVEARVPRSARAVACALIQFHDCQPAMKVRLHPGRTPPRSVRRA